MYLSDLYVLSHLVSVSENKSVLKIFKNTFKKFKIFKFIGFIAWFVEIRNKFFLAYMTWQ